MNLDDFLISVDTNEPPEELSVLLKALWWDKKGNWDRAHDTAQDIHDKDGSWVHAYLHRKEGDEFNAGYWYVRSGRPKSNLSLEEEWEIIVSEFLNK